MVGVALAAEEITTGTGPGDGVHETGSQDGVDECGFSGTCGSVQRKKVKKRVEYCKCVLQCSDKTSTLLLYAKDAKDFCCVVLL